MYKKLVCGLFVNSTFATEQDQALVLSIEEKLAALSYCNKDQPCNIYIEKSELGYSTKVIKAALITKDGVLKYLPSETHYTIE